MPLGVTSNYLLSVILVQPLVGSTLSKDSHMISIKLSFSNQYVLHGKLQVKFSLSMYHKWERIWEKGPIGIFSRHIS